MTTYRTNVTGAVWLLLMGCSDTGESDQTYWTGAHDLGGATTPLPMLGGPKMLDGPAVTVKYTTLSQQGAYAPRNVGVVWVTNASGEYIRTLDLWGTLFISQLKTWIGELPGSVQAAAEELDVTDAVSGATALAFGPREAKWNFTHYTGATAPDGVYTVHIEVTDKDETGETVTFDLPVGAGAQDFQVPDANFFAAITVDYP